MIIYTNLFGSFTARESDQQYLIGSIDDSRLKNKVHKKVAVRIA